MNEDLNGYKTLLKEAEAELKTKNKSLKRDTARLDKDIDLLNKKLEEIKEKQYKVEKSIGLQGPTLIQCLTDIRTFGRAIEKGTSGFSPLVGILKGNFMFSLCVWPVMLHKLYFHRRKTNGSI